MPTNFRIYDRRCRIVLVGMQKSAYTSGRGCRSCFLATRAASVATDSFRISTRRVILMTTVENSKDKTLQTYKVAAGRSSVSGLSSGAFMTVQLHLAHSSSFCGAGIVAGGPFRCAESFREAAFLAEDAF